MKRSTLASKQVDWSGEAAAIASDGDYKYGGDPGDIVHTNMSTFKSAAPQGRAYSITGENAAIWARTTETARRR